MITFPYYALLRKSPYNYWYFFICDKDEETQTTYEDKWLSIIAVKPQNHIPWLEYIVYKIKESFPEKQKMKNYFGELEEILLFDKERKLKETLSYKTPKDLYTNFLVRSNFLHGWGSNFETNAKRGLLTWANINPHDEPNDLHWLKWGSPFGAICKPQRMAGMVFMLQQQTGMSNSMADTLRDL